MGRAELPPRTRHDGVARAPGSSTEPWIPWLSGLRATGPESCSEASAGAAIASRRAADPEHVFTGSLGHLASAPAVESITDFVDRLSTKGVLRVYETAFQTIFERFLSPQKKHRIAVACRWATSA